jgi:DNA-binding response OmpR family regulator
MTRSVAHAEAVSGKPELRRGPLVLAPAALAVVGYHDKAVLTPLQFRFIYALAERIEEVVPKTEIYASFWERDRPDPKVLDVTACNLRHALARLSEKAPGHLVTIYGIGYCLTEDPVVEPTRKRAGSSPVHLGLGARLRTLQRGSYATA